MGAVFIKIINMSITAGWIVLAVLLVRLLFKKKAPKALFPVLWGIVAIRLICPITFESNFSLIRNAEPVEQVALPEELFSKAEGELPEENKNTGNKGNASEDYIVHGPGENKGDGYYITEYEPIPGNKVDESLPDVSNQGPEFVESNTNYNENKESDVSVPGTDVENNKNSVKDKKTDPSTVIGIIWLSGMGIMLMYTAFSYFRIYRRVAESAPLAEKIRVCDHIDSPFILGVIRPKIYLPSDIKSEDRVYVLAHERAHLKRLDHIWKPLGFLLLTIYWFHPLLWVGYILLCKDIEYACDEKVIKELGQEQKKTYSTALINCSVSKKMISACPLAFGETGVKGRVKSVLHYKKPAFWIIIASVVLCTVLAVCFLTNPLRKADALKAGDIVTFGDYEQDNVTENGAEPIEWIVLDVFDGKATLLSKYGLDAKPFHDSDAEDTTWAYCSLRSWLNAEFYKTAFNEKERNQILTTTLENYGSEKYNIFIGKTVTEDKVYLLSNEEVLQSFETNNGRTSGENAFASMASRTTATEYAKAQGAWEETLEDGVYSPWLLRTSGKGVDFVTRVSTRGELSFDSYTTYGGNAIRPVIRISLSEGNYEIVEETGNEEATPHTRVGRFKDVVPLEDAKPGYVVTFGRYAEDEGDIVYIYDIEWYVLDVKDGKALLLSKYVMESMPYHEKEEAVSWADCSLREWLNGTFYNKAFNEEEQARITTTLLENTWNPWNTSAGYEYTEDKVFIPSIEDMLSGNYDYNVSNSEASDYQFDGYFQTSRERMARRTRGLKGNSENTSDYSASGYWLRASSRLLEMSNFEPGNFYHNVASIMENGDFITSDLPVENICGVRPAIWVEIDDSKEKDSGKQKERKSSWFISFGLPERYQYKEIKGAFLEYLNHEAYLYPTNYPQEQYTCSFDIYCSTDMKTNRVYLKTVSQGTEVWYVCTPTEYLDKKSPLIVSTIDTASLELLRKNGKLKSLGSDSVKVPAVTKPEHQNVTENDNEKYTTDVENIAKLLLKNGITTRNGAVDTVKLEVWISGFNTEKRQLPYAYVVINDTLVYESELSKKDGLFASFFEDNLSKDQTLRELFGKDAYVPSEFHGNGIKLLSSVDAQQMERVKDFAVFHCVHEEECSETILIDGKEVRLPKQNVGTQNQNKIAFVPIKTEGNITQYDIYRSTDKGLSWNRVAENYRTTAGDIAAIEIPTHQDVVCYFKRNGETESRYILSEDGGATWNTSNQKSKPNAELKDAAIGNSVVFGTYEQDGIYENGDEELEWIVLDRVGDKVLLLAKYGVFLNKYDSEFFHEVTWEDSFLRDWLQKRFYANAFTAAERTMIEKTVIHTPNANGEDIVSEDYVFLLSASEAANGKAQDGTPYFTGDSDRVLVPAASVLLDGSLEGDMEGTIWHGPTCVWWLRTSGSPTQRTAVVNRDGSILEEGMLYYARGSAIRPAVWVDVSSLPETGNTPEKGNEGSSLNAGKLTERIENTKISIAIGDEYAAYLDETGKLHVLYDTSLIWEWDPVGATRGIDLTKTYKALGTDPYRLVAIDEEGRLSVSYYQTAEEMQAILEQTIKEIAEAGGNYGTSGKRDPGIAKDFETITGVKQIFSTYPYDEYTALFEDGTVFCLVEKKELKGAVQVTAKAGGVIAGLLPDGTLVMSKITDASRKEKLDAWPKKLKQICSCHSYFIGTDVFIGLCEDGTVISEGVEQEYLINTIEQWSGIVKIAVGNETVVGLKGDGTVVAVCPGRSDVGQCDVDDWTDVIAVNTNGKVTIGITKDGKVLMAGAVPELVKELPERYNYEEIKTVFLEYMNHQAWLYPSNYPQESYTCSYELYRSANDDNKTKYVYLKTIINDTEHWVSFEPEKYNIPTSPVRVVVQRTDYMRERLENGGIVSIGSDKIYIPAPTKPAYGNPVDLTNDISSIYSDLKQNGYRDNLRLEVIVSEYDLEKNLYPYVYLIINDSQVFETSFGELEGNSIGLFPLSKMFYYGNYTRDYTIEYGDGWPEVFDGHGIKPLDSVDTKQLERVKACASYHQMVKENSSETILIDGQTIEIDSPNIGINEALGVRIAFLPQGAAAGSVYYNIYRSDDRGQSWRMLVEDSCVANGDFARILIPDKDTVVCFFEISGNTSQSSCIVSEDGGVTWNYATYPSKLTGDIDNPKIGTSVIFGDYEQDGDYSNGKEPLEWIVLDRDGDKALLLSKYGIETLLWDKDKTLESWEVDDLYWMMNRTIYEYAFSAEERAALIKTKPIENESMDDYPYGVLQYPGYTILLDTDDVLYGKGQDGTPYFRTEDSRITIPTAYAAQKGAWLDKNLAFTDVEVPWIITVSGTTGGDFSEVQFARVMPDGSISYEEEAIKEAHILIRPAIWVDVTKIPN